MAASKAQVNLYVRRSRVQRLKDGLRFLGTLPGLAVHTVRGWPRILKVLLVVTGIIAGVGAAIAGRLFFKHRALESAVLRERIAYDHEIRNNPEPAKLVEILDRILELRPDDSVARAHKKAIESGEADPSEPNIVMVVVREHLKGSRFDAALRESEKRVAYEHRDFYSHFLLAKLLLDKGQPEAAEPHLAAIADPAGHNVNLNFGAIASAMQLLTQQQRDASRLRAFVSEQMMPMVQADWAAKAECETQVMLLYLLGDTFRLPKLPPNAGLTWPSANEMANLCFNGAKANNDIPTLGRLATLGPPFSEALTRMKAANQITEPQRVEFARANEERTRAAWNLVLEKQPKNGEAYLGLVQSYARSGMNKETVESLMHGLDVCGDDPLLLQVFNNVAMANDREKLGYSRLKEAAERTPSFPKYWFLSAQAALKGDRRDLAIEALDKARAALPNDRDIIIMQADVYTGTGYPEKVLAALAAIPDSELASMPRAAELFARALVEIGDQERLEAFLDQALDITRRAKNPLAVYYVGLGLYGASNPRPERDDRTAEYLIRLVEDYRVTFPPIAALNAAALVRACEGRPGLIDPVSARKAIIACDQCMAVDVNNVAIAAARLRLRLRGDKDPVKALTEIEALTANLDRLTPEQAESLGMTYNANKLYDDAIRVVKPYTVGRTTAGCLVQLAIAYKGQGRADDAENALRRANDFTMTERERADYQAARDLLTTKVKP